jgi:membrane protein YdbS with pleckstrin-like domain
VLLVVAVVLLRIAAYALSEQAAKTVVVVALVLQNLIGYVTYPHSLVRLRRVRIDTLVFCEYFDIVKGILSDSRKIRILQKAL